MSAAELKLGRRIEHARICVLPPLFGVQHHSSVVRRGNPLLMGFPKTNNRSTRVNSAHGVLRKLGLEGDNPGVFCGEWLGSGRLLKSISPIDGKLLATVRTATAEQYERTIKRAQVAFEEWRAVPAPKRGEIIRQLGNALREAKQDLGRLVTLETGKIIAEGEGEVQEMIDICDF